VRLLFVIDNSSLITYLCQQKTKGDKAMNTQKHTKSTICSKPMHYMRILTFFINPAPPYFKVSSRFDPTLRQKDADANHLNPYNQPIVKRVRMQLV
jgi:hypothetical protein